MLPQRRHLRRDVLALRRYPRIAVNSGVYSAPNFCTKKPNRIANILIFATQWGAARNTNPHEPLYGESVIGTIFRAFGSKSGGKIVSAEYLTELRAAPIRPALARSACRRSAPRRSALVRSISLRLA